MKSKKKKTLEIWVLLIVILLFSPISALIGLSSDYHDKNPVIIAPGETKEIVFGRFQNTGDKDVTLKIELVEGGNIATLLSQSLDSFVLPAGTTNTELRTKITIPSDIPEGYQYGITIKYQDIAPLEEGGMIQITESKTSTIPVVVKKPEKAEINLLPWLILIILIILIIIVIIYLILQKNKQIYSIKRK